MPGRKYEASRLPEGRSRKQARQKFEEDEQQRCGKRADKQRSRRPGSSALRAAVQTLRGHGHRWQTVRPGAGAAVRGRGAATALRCARGRGRSAARRAQAARAGGSRPGPPGRRDVRSASTPARRRAMMVSMRGRRRRRALLSRRGRRRSACWGCGCRSDDVRDGLGCFPLDAGGACRNRLGLARGSRGDDGRARRELLRSQSLRIGDRGVRLLLRRGAERIRACRRRNGEDAARDHRDESADAHILMFGPSCFDRHRPPGGSCSPRPGGSRRPSSATARPAAHVGLPRRPPRHGCRRRAFASRC